MTARQGVRQPGLDGLRALAVLAVVAFHAGLPFARGGYLGVDAFFVLSGFLITRLLLQEVREHDRVDLARFWSRRMGRLVPALLVVVTTVVVVEAVRHAGDLAALRSDAVAALLYVSNWRFLLQSDGYFGQTAEPSLLQHTWSLGIEEQFYVVWPLVVMLCARARRPARVVAVTALTGVVLSAGIMVALAEQGAGEARLYFGTDTRMQAVLLGSALAAVTVGGLPIHAAGGRRAMVRRASLHGLAVIGLAVTALLWWRLEGSDPVLYRGGFTLAALATAAVIPSVALVPLGPVGRVLGVAPLRALGGVSYGVYLWHWPVQRLLTASATGLHGVALHGARVAVILVAAVLSHRLIERPVRQRQPQPQVRLVTLSTLAVGVAGVLVVVAVHASPPEEVRLETASGLITSPPPAPPRTTTTRAPTTTAPTTTGAPATTQPPPPPTTTTTTAPPLSPVYRLELLGDSVSQSIAVGLAPMGHQYGLAVYNDGILGCGVAPVGDYRLRGVEYGLAGQCMRWESTWASRVRAARPQVALVQVGRHEVLDRRIDGQWTNITAPGYAAEVAVGLDRAIELAGAEGGTVVVLTAPYYQTGERPDGGQWPENDPARVNRLNQLIREAVARNPGSFVVDLGGHTNPSGRYAYTVDGVRMRRDGVHYSEAACRWFASWLVPQLRDAASRSGVT